MRGEQDGAGEEDDPGGVTVGREHAGSERGGECGSM